MFSAAAVPKEFQNKNITCTKIGGGENSKSWPGQMCGDSVEGVTGTVACVDGSDCTDGVCVAKAGDGDSCKTGETSSSSMCPPSHYCNPTATDGPKCEAKLADKAECATNGAADQCGLGSLCVQAGAAEKGACMAYGTVEAGSLLTGWTFGDMTQNNLVCKGGHVMETKGEESTTYHCMTPTSNEGDPKTAVDVGAACKTKVFNQVDKPTESTEGTATALCGFNEKATAFCPAQLGDENIQTAISNAIPVWTGQRTTCHDGGNTLLCKEFSNDNRETIATFNKDWSLGTNLQGWPNIANNAACVQGTYSSWYYGANAATVSAVAAVAALSIVF